MDNKIASFKHKCFKCENLYFENRLKSYQVPKSICCEGFVQVCNFVTKCKNYRRFLEGSVVKLLYEDGLCQTAK